MAETTIDTLTIKSFLSSVKLSPDISRPTPMLQSNLETLVEDVSAEERFVSSMAAVVYNMPKDEDRFDKQTIQELVADIDKLVEAQINEILHAPEFQALESAWTSIADLVRNVNFRANMDISLLDATKEELFEDLELTSQDIAGSEIFKKIYVAEYDQFGGQPYGALIGLYDFANTPKDILFLRTIGKIATAAHSPFIGNVSPKFFGCETFAEVNLLRDIAGMVDTPAYAAWNQLRNSEEAAYLGLVAPRYLARTPWNDITNPADRINFTERVHGERNNEYLWAPGSMLLARNLAKSFETSGWCQYLRGVKGGGLVEGLPTYTYNLRGEDELRAPIEISMPDFRELELANTGVIPIIHKKGSADAVFFSVQSLKKAHKFKDPKDSENSQLVTNLSYTFSITRIAHYLKCIMRDNIGSSANAEYINAQITSWISRFVTTVVNPDDLTLRYFPFKAYSLEVTDVPGKVGWYHCNLSVLPHIQFEGMDVDLRVDARLG
jgi:type VI secretion system protein ImpC